MKPTLFTLLTFSLVATALSGCLGPLADGPQVGHVITVDWAAYNDDGTRIDGGEGLTFALGTGDSGLGCGFEVALTGASPYETVSFHAPLDAADPYDGVIITPRDQLEPFDVMQEVDQLTFENQIGPAEVGMEFPISFYAGVVRGVADNTVTFEVIPEPGQRDVVDWVGLVLVTDVKDGMIQQDLQADVGTTFAVQAFSGAPLEGLVAGSYRACGTSASHVFYAHTADEVPEDQPAPATARFEVTITDVRAQQVEFSEDAFVARRSPVLEASPEEVLAAAAASGSTPASDGHNDDGHDHTH